MTRCKVVYAATPRGLEEALNGFLEATPCFDVDVKLMIDGQFYLALVIYWIDETLVGDKGGDA